MVCLKWTSQSNNTFHALPSMRYCSEKSFLAKQINDGIYLSSCVSSILSTSSFLLSLNKQTTKWNCILFVNKCFRSLFLSTTHIPFLPLTTVLLFFLQEGREEDKKGFLYEVINLILFHIIYFIMQFTRQGDDCLKLSNCPATDSHEIHCIINSFLTHLV